MPCSRARRPFGLNVETAVRLPGLPGSGGASGWLLSEVFEMEHEANTAGLPEAERIARPTPSDQADIWSAHGRGWCGGGGLSGDGSGSSAQSVIVRRGRDFKGFWKKGLRLVRLVKDKRRDSPL